MRSDAVKTGTQLLFNQLEELIKYKAKYKINYRDDQI